MNNDLKKRIEEWGRKRFDDQSFCNELIADLIDEVRRMDADVKVFKRSEIAQTRTIGDLVDKLNIATDALEVYKNEDNWEYDSDVGFFDYGSGPETAEKALKEIEEE